MDAAGYRARAAEMRRFAEQEHNPTLREQFLGLVAEYEKLAARAEKRAGREGKAAGPNKGAAKQ